LAQGHDGGRGDSVIAMSDRGSITLGDLRGKLTTLEAAVGSASATGCSAWNG